MRLTKTERSILKRIHQKGEFPASWWPKAAQKLDTLGLIDGYGRGRRTIIELTAKGRALLEDQ
jgi:predicted transcriptional regulator